MASAIAAGALMVTVAGASVAAAAPVDTGLAPLAAPTSSPGDNSINGYRNVGYFAQWGVYGRNFQVSDLVRNGAAAQLTHINYSFANIHHQDLGCFMANKAAQEGAPEGAGDAYADYGKTYNSSNSVNGTDDKWDQPIAGNFNQLRQLKEMYPDLKVMVSLGGWTYSKYFSKAVATPQARQHLAASCIDVYIKGNVPVIDGFGGPGTAAGIFDGIDIDWEWPGSPNGEANNYVDAVNDRANFKAFIIELRRQLDALEAQTGKEYLMSAFLPANQEDITAGGWNDPELFNYLDFGNIQGYDLWGAWDTSLNGHQANLYNDPADPRAASKRFSVDKAVNAYLSAGIDPAQLGIGLAAYGRGWTGVPSSTPWQAGSYQGAQGTYERGIEDYYKLKGTGTEYYDATAGAGWIYQSGSNTWWSLDTVSTVNLKADYIVSKGLGGGMWWELSGDRNNDLISKLNAKLLAAPEGPVTGGGGGGVHPTPTPTPTVTPDPSPSPTTTNPVDNCPAAWSSSAVYVGGNEVSYNGRIYRAKWWTQGNVPGTEEWGPWDNIGPCGGTNPSPTPTVTPTQTPSPTPTVTPSESPSPTPTTTPTGDACYAAWSSSAIYVGGDHVTYQGVNYRAKWWTQGNVPGTEEWGPWESLGACDEGGTGEPSPTPTVTVSPSQTPTPTVTPTQTPSPTPTVTPTDPPGEHELCRPDGMARTPGIDTPYCDVYDANGREILPNGLDRRVVAYFTSWRTGKDGTPSYLASDIPWDKVSHINYAFAHIGNDYRISVNQNVEGNPATDMTWSGVTMDPSLAYTGHFNLIQQFKAQHPGVKVIPAVGGWAETGGYFDGDGNRVASGGFYAMTASQDRINTFADSAVNFIRTYGLDGIDIDYEYPTSNLAAGNPEDFWIADVNRGRLFSGYVDLMRTLREKLDAAGAADGNYYLLTAAVPSSGYLLRGHEVYQVTQYLDYLNVMSYDLHGSWNSYVGGMSPLFDNGNDPELTAGGVYSAYQNIGYLNGDWAAHYFQGAMQAGRINLGVGFYSRGFDGVNGGNNGDGGTAPMPWGQPCPAGTGGNTACGNGAQGINNLWHDLDANGNQIGAGVNPVWHLKNLQQGIVGDYVASYGVPTTITGTYSHHFDNVSKNEWLWNATTRTYLSGDQEQAMTAKANYVADSGLGGVMIWELAGDYDWNSAKGQYEMGDSLVSLLHSTLSSTTPYDALKAAPGASTPTKAIDLSVRYTEFALGDNNYPISPKVVFTNNSNTAIPAGAVITYQFGTTTTATMGSWSGLIPAVTPGHTGNNIGGLNGVFHTASFTVPAGGIPAHGSLTNQLVWSLPIAQFSNVTVTINGTKYATTYDNLRGVTVVEPGQ